MLSRPQPGRFLRRAPLALGLPMAVLVGCVGQHVQSPLDPAAPEAREIARLWWVLFWICTAVFVVTLMLALQAARRGGTPTPQQIGRLTGIQFIVLSGILIPTIILVGILLYSLRATLALIPGDAEFTIEVTGHQWWWEVRYVEQDIVTANEIHLPAGQPVRLRLRSADVIHSFWVPNLHGKMDVFPDHDTELVLRADRPGVLRGQCAEFCGIQHTWMTFSVVVLTPDAFDAWVARHQPAPETVLEPALVEGQQRFFHHGCAACHAIRGTPAVARLGPDLTHLSSRRTLGAGLMPNDRENLRAWILRPQEMKQGIRMPPTTPPPEELEALLTYLESLR
jgi:cytochrome c oxidase subunit II